MEICVKSEGGELVEISVKSKVDRFVEISELVEI